jgi:hypothetical protein
MAYPGQDQQMQSQVHLQRPPYNDSILTITEKSCADPYVLWDKGTYYMVSTQVRRDINVLICADMDHRLLGRDLVSGQSI